MGKKEKKTSVHQEEAEKDKPNFFSSLQTVTKASEVAGTTLQLQKLCTKISHLQE